MTRGIGAIQALQQLIPEWLIPLFIVITYLGSVGVILPLLALLYWRWDAERTAFVGGAVLGGFALALTLKNVFELPRPPMSLHLVYATGYGFPSGHAIDSTVASGSLASVLTAGTRWQRVLLASLLIGLVPLSRVVLGVHYGVDVVVGVGVGLLYLLVVVRLLDRQVVPSLFLATALTVTGVITAGAAWNSMVLLGGILLALYGWTRRGATDV